jgi:hypothetical protein
LSFGDVGGNGDRVVGEACAQRIGGLDLWGVGEEFYIVNCDGAGSGSVGEALLKALAEEVEVEGGLGGWGDLGEIDTYGAAVVG